MKRLLLLPAALLFLLVFLSLPALARPKSLPRPAFILVQLFSYRDKIAYLRQSGKADVADQLREEAAEAARLTRRDFAQNFRYCPVYFYADTNVLRIHAHQYAGLLTDADGNPVATPPAAEDSTHFLAYYGYYAGDAANAADPARVRNGPFLNLLSHRGIHLSPDRLSTMRGNLRMYQLYRKSGPDRVRGFRSKRFSFAEYLPVAERLQSRLTSYFGK